MKWLGRTADYYGYGLGPGTPLSYEQAETFTVAVQMTCDDVESGATTWAESIAADMGDGAPRADAVGFNAFLRDQFCPGMAGISADNGSVGTSTPSRTAEPLPKCPNLGDLSPRVSTAEIAGLAADGYTRLMEAKITLSNPVEYPLYLWLGFESVDIGNTAFFQETPGLEFFAGSVADSYRWLRVPAKATRTFTFPAEWVPGFGLPRVALQSMAVADRHTLGRAVDCRYNDAG